MSHFYMFIEQQYILHTNLQSVYEIYKNFWGKILIPKSIFFAEKTPLDKNDREHINKEINENYKVMYKQSDIVIVDFKTWHSTMSERIDPVDLSSRLNTTVINYSRWGEASVVIATKGKIELSLTAGYDGSIEIKPDHSQRFSEIINRLKETKKSPAQDGPDIGDIIDPNLENILKIMNVDVEKIYEPDIHAIQEAVTYDLFIKW